MNLKALYIIMSTGLCAIGAGAATVDTLLVETSHLATPMKVTVVTPDAADDPTLKFPTAYLLNGYDGDYRSWISSTAPLAELADIYEMVLVMPDGRDSWYWDSPLHPEMQMETFFVEDLVPAIDANYPTYESAGQRAITGLSMGGHGALWLAMRHSDVWGNAGSMSGGVNIMPFPKSWKMAQWLGPQAENEDVWREHTVVSLVPNLEPGAVNITVDCGVDDFFAGVNRELHEAMLAAGIPHDYTERPGKHTWSYWTNSILYHLLFFNEKFKEDAAK